MAYIPTPNQSVSGTVGASIIGHAPTVIVGGSILTTSTANQSVSGTVGSSVLGHAPVVIVGGSILTSSTPNQSVSGAVDVGNFPTTQNVSGSVAAWLQSTNASVITVGGSNPANQSVSGTVNIGNTPTFLQLAGSILATSATVTPAANQSVSGTVGASVVGHAPVVIVGGSILTSSTPNQSVSGTVQSEQTGIRITSVVSANPSSMLVGASVIGLTPVNITNLPTTQNVSGSVAAWLQSTNASVITVGTAAANQSVSGTVGASAIGTFPVTQSGTWQPSALGYLTRNDAIASFLGANLTTRPLAGDSAGRIVAKPFAPEESRIEGYNSVVSGSVTTLIAAAGAGLRNYITDLWITNTGSTATLVTLRSAGGASVLGYTIAPATGGSNLPGLHTPIRTGVNETFDFQATTPQSVLYATAKGFKAP